jgi:nicotinate-nucleotide--dimethylbenzimidazole phosphoribosyltransferase
MRAAAVRRIASLTMPCRALGRLLDLAEDLAEITDSLTPPVERKRIIVMAADHGVAAQQVSQYPQEVTGQMVRNFVQGGAAVNVLAEVAGAAVTVADMGTVSDLSDLAAAGKIVSRKTASGTADISEGPAMSREEAVRCIETGIEIACGLADETDVFGTGEMGIGNTTPSAAVIAAFCDLAPSTVTGRGTGVDSARYAHKIAIIEKALAVNRPDVKDGVDVLAKIGGFEIGGMAGVMLGAASCGKPVLVDGLISSAAALIAQSLCPLCTGFMIAAHKSEEVGHAPALERLGLVPLLDLGFRLGEGTGCAVAMQLIDAAAAVLTKMATFEEAEVAGSCE